MRQQIARFLVAGAVGFIVDAGVLYLGLLVGLGYFAGRALSFLCAVWTTWKINRHYTFASTRRTSSVWTEWWRYLVAMSAGGSINYAVYSCVVIFVRATVWLPVCAIALGSVAGLAVNFVSAKWWVFKRNS